MFSPVFSLSLCFSLVFSLLSKWYKWQTQEKRKKGDFFLFSGLPNGPPDWAYLFCLSAKKCSGLNRKCRPLYSEQRIHFQKIVWAYIWFGHGTKKVGLTLTVHLIQFWISAYYAIPTLKQWRVRHVPSVFGIPLGSKYSPIAIFSN